MSRPTLDPMMSVRTPPPLSEVDLLIMTLLTFGPLDFPLACRIFSLLQSSAGDGPISPFPRPSNEHHLYTATLVFCAEGFIQRLSQGGWNFFPTHLWVSFPIDSGHCFQFRGLACWFAPSLLLHARPKSFPFDPLTPLASKTSGFGHIGVKTISRRTRWPPGFPPGDLP